MNLEKMQSRELLLLYANILDELKTRKILRTKNNPVGDYAEWLVKAALGYELQTNSNSGFDAIDKDGIRYQIKSRRITEENKSTQLSAIRNLDRKDFDFLIVVLFDREFQISRAIQLPHSTVEKHAKYRDHVNGHILHVRSTLLADSTVVDITNILKKVEV
jgi:hypothetical protein